MTSASLASVKTTSDSDEHYTNPIMVREALQHLPAGALAGKWVHLPCNDGMDSAFTQYFIKHFTRLGLARLTALSYRPPQASYLDTAPREPARLYSQCRNSSSLVDVRGSGGWQSELGLGLIKEADAIFTNPPFSTISTFVTMLHKYNKEYAIIAPFTSLHYTAVYPILYSGKAIAHKQDDKIMESKFIIPDGSLKRSPYYWLSTYPLPKVPLSHCVQWDASKASNYPILDAPMDWLREANFIVGVPLGYYDWLSVPVNFLLYDLSDWHLHKNVSKKIRLNGKELFRRIFIKERRSSDAHSSVDSLCPSHRTMRLF